MPKDRRLKVSGKYNEKLTIGKTTKSGAVKTKTVDIRQNTVTKTKALPNGKVVTKTKPITDKGITRLVKRGR